MWFVVMSKPTGDREATRGLEPLNLAWMREQHDAGRVLFSGPTAQGTGIWVMKGDSREQIEALLQTHPWVQKGLRDVSEIYDWRVQQVLGMGNFEGPAGRQNPPA